MYLRTYSYFICKLLQEFSLGENFQSRLVLLSIIYHIHVCCILLCPIVYNKQNIKNNVLSRAKREISLIVFSYFPIRVINVFIPFTSDVFLLLLTADWKRARLKHSIVSYSSVNCRFIPLRRILVLMKAVFYK